MNVSGSDDLGVNYDTWRRQGSIRLINIVPLLYQYIILREKYMIVFFILFLYTFPLLKSEETIGSVSVDTSLGKVLGKREGNVISYLGIPYAEPPIGKLRFKPPVPKRPWAPHVHNAYEYGYECLQSTLYSAELSFIQDEGILDS